MYSEQLEMTVRLHTLRRSFHEMLQLLLYEFLRCFFGCFTQEHLRDLSREIDEISSMNHNFTSWSVKSSKQLSAALRHDYKVKLGRYMEASIEDLHTHTRLRCFDWEPRKFFAFLAANSKGRFSIWIAPVALTFSRFFDWDFAIEHWSYSGAHSLSGRRLRGSPGRETDH